MRGPALVLASFAVTLAVGAATGRSAPRAVPFDPTCGPSRTATRTVNGTLGSVELHGTPKRIVALEFSFVDDLVQVGVSPIGIADDHDPSRIIPAVRAKLEPYTSVGLRQSPALERIASLHPDLIVADATRDVGIYRQLQAIAPTVALDSLKEAYLPSRHAAVVVGQAVNKCGAMVRRLKQDTMVMKRLRAAVMRATHRAGEKRKAMFAVVTAQVWNVHSSLEYTPSLLANIGIPSANVLPRNSSNVQSPDFVMSEEDLLSNDPDVLFVAESQPSSTLFDQWSKDPLFRTLRAARTKQTYVVNQNVWSRARGLQAGEVICQQAVHLLYSVYVPITLPDVKGS
jgi:ABC-type Fe3+-citrate transport system substrate-binding protein